ncbi:MAG: prephenate dehydrogenase [Candidatus Omnitrophota bacterium]|nr:prephenate dehydrogenase [Candidatus Omnitrophota bacterium]
MKHFKKVTIIGVGLIGGSIGLATKEKGLAREVVGVFRRPSTLSKALKRKAVDKGTISIKEGVCDADLVILATPVHKIVVIAREAIRYAKDGAIITDVGSTKAWIVNKIENMLPKNSSISFVGSHPMAGSEKKSVEFARRDLLQGTPCIVTRTGRTDGRSLKRIAGFWKALGAKVKILSPLEHDRSVSLISHLPHIVAFSLAGAVGLKTLELAAEGYKDTTRVASSDPELWSDIFLTNRREIAKACKVFEKYYNDILNAVTKGDYKKTVKLLRLAKSKRDKFIYAK